VRGNKGINRGYDIVTSEAHIQKIRRLKRGIRKRQGVSPRYRDRADINALDPSCVPEDRCREMTLAAPKLQNTFTSHIGPNDSPEGSIPAQRLTDPPRIGRFIVGVEITGAAQEVYP